MDLEPDVLVIGGGMAGLVAGTVAAQDGLDVLLIRRGQGSTAMSSGAIDICGYMRGATVHFESPIEAIQTITRVHPLHPYSIIAYDEGGIVPEKSIKYIKDATNWLKKQLARSIAAIEGDLSRNLMQLTQIGTTKPTCFVQGSMVHPGLYDNDSRPLFVGIRGHSDFNAAITANTFLQYRMDIDMAPRIVLNEMIDLSPHGRHHNIASIEIARFLDTEEGLEKITSILKNEVKRTGATHVVLPAVLGIERAIDNAKHLSKETQATVFETLAFPPSVPGLRLQMALDRIFQASGGTLILGHKAVSGVFKGETLVEVKASGPKRKISIRPKAAVLATGKFISEGLLGSQKGVREPLFGLVTVTGEFYDASEEYPRRHTRPIPFTNRGHDIFQFGVPVDENLRPVDYNGRAKAENLFAAGAIIAGYDFSSEKSGLGVALTTGYVAGEKVIRNIRSDI